MSGDSRPKPVGSHPSTVAFAVHPFVTHPRHDRCAICDRSLSIHSSVWRPNQTGDGRPGTATEDQ